MWWTWRLLPAPRDGETSAGFRWCVACEMLTRLLLRCSPRLTAYGFAAHVLLGRCGRRFHGAGVQRSPVNSFDSSLASHRSSVVTRAVSPAVRVHVRVRHALRHFHAHTISFLAARPRACPGVRGHTPASTAPGAERPRLAD